MSNGDEARDEVEALKHELTAVREELAAAQAQAEHFRLLANAALEGVVFHEHGMMIDVNDAFAAMLGYDANELIGKDALSLATPETRHIVRHHVETESTEPYEVVGLRKDGSTFPAEIIGRMVIYQGRKLRIAIVRDITRRKHSDRRVQESEFRYRILADNASDVIWTLSLDGQFTYVSPSVTWLCGFSVAEVQGRTLDQLLTPASFEEAQTALEWVIAQELAGNQLQKPRRYELEIIHREGGTVWTETTTSVLRDDEERPVGILGVSRDMTRRREAQLALAHERNLLRTLIDHLPESIYVKDLDGRHVLNNAASLVAMGAKTQTDTVGKTCADLRPGHAVWTAAEQYVLRTGAIFTDDEIRQGMNGNEEWVLVSRLPLYDAEGQLTGVVGIDRDITAQKESELNLLELAIEREQVVMMQKFIGDVSHDLRTPLTTMKLSQAVLARSPDPEQRRQHLGILRAETDRLEQSLGDLFNLVRLDQHVTLELVRCDLRALLRQVVEDRRKQAEQKNQIFTVSLPDGPVWVLGDQAQLEQAFGAIVTNALSYTPEGGAITVRLRNKGRRAVVDVQDTGIGIPQDDLPHIFTRFYRADPARPTQTGGSGVGLAIAKKVIDLHGGGIRVASAPGEGSTFTILLRLLELGGGAEG